MIEYFITTTLTISCHRLFVLTHTMHSRIQTRFVKIFIICAWLINIGVVAVLAISDTIVYFDPYEFDCAPYARNRIKLYWTIAYYVYVLIPSILMIITNIWILVVAAKFAKSRTGEPLPSKSAVVTVSLICWVYVASYLPIFIRRVMDTPPWFIYFSMYALSVSFVANPIIYTATNNRFRCFVKRIIVANWRKLARNSVAV